MRFKLLKLRSVAKPCRLALGVVLLYSGVMKLRDPSQAIEFIEAITFYRAPWIATAAGALEVFVGIALLFSIAAPYLSRIAVALSVVFFTTHAFSMTLPEPPPPCGCLGATETPDGIASAKYESLWWLGLTAGMTLCGCLVAAAPAREQPVLQESVSRPSEEPVDAT